MKILIIGASGLLARPVIREMDRAGFQLRLFSRSVNPSMFEPEYEMIRGDVLNPSDLNRAMTGCDAVHISLAKINEAQAAKVVVDMAGHHGIRLISLVSGCTVAKENCWFPMIENKYKAEQTIIQSGIPYLILRPTWFFETLALMIRDGKAMMIGKQPHPAHWVAARDFARMIVNAYQKPEAKNKALYIHGPEPHRMKDLLEKYCRLRHPGITKISTVPIGVLKMMAIFTHNRELKDVAAMFGYFEKVKEMGDPSEANHLLGKPTTTFEKWLQTTL